MECVPGSSAVTAQHDLRFHVKIVFIVTEIFVFGIQAICVLYSGKSDLLLAFVQRHGIRLTEILGKGGCGGEAPHLKGGLGVKPSSLGQVL